MIILIAPAIGWTWPALVPIVSAAAGYLGFKKLTSSGDGAWLEGRLTQTLREQRIVRVPIDNQVVQPIADEMGNDEMLTFEREDCTMIFRKDVKGKFFVDVMSRGEHTGVQLQAIGEEFAYSLVQEFAHSKVVKELDRIGVTVVGEERDEEGNIVLDTRRWGRIS